MLPPHCGHTRLMIDEMIVLGSPGNMLMILMALPVSGASATRINDARCSRRLRMSVNLTPVSFHSQTLHAGWLRNSSVACTDRRLAAWFACKLHAKNYA
jgi:hypothetical protein